MSAVPVAVRGYLEGLGARAPSSLEEMPLQLRLAVSFKADYETTYGDEEGWEDVPAQLAQLIPDEVVERVQYWASATRASTLDLVCEGERLIRKVAAA